MRDRGRAAVRPLSALVSRLSAGFLERNANGAGERDGSQNIPGDREGDLPNARTAFLGFLLATPGFKLSLRIPTGCEAIVRAPVRELISSGTDFLHIAFPRKG